MRIELIKDARITHKAGEIVEVSPDEGAFLLGVGSARKADTVTEVETKSETKRKTIRKK